jgi:hypothetical protein
MKYKGLTTIKNKAIAQAEKNCKENPNILRTFWFPHNKEIRLIEVEEIGVTCANGEVDTFSFDNNGLLGIILPEEIGKVELPIGWGVWDNAEELLIEGKKT